MPRCCQHGPAPQQSGGHAGRGEWQGSPRPRSCRARAGCRTARWCGPPQSCSRTCSGGFWGVGQRVACQEGCDAVLLPGSAQGLGAPSLPLTGRSRLSRWRRGSRCCSPQCSRRRCHSRQCWTPGQSSRTGQEPGTHSRSRCCPPGSRCPPAGCRTARACHRCSTTRTRWCQAPSGCSTGLRARGQQTRRGVWGGVRDGECAAGSAGEAAQPAGRHGAVWAHPQGRCSARSTRPASRDCPGCRQDAQGSGDESAQLWCRLGRDGAALTGSLAQGWADRQGLPGGGQHGQDREDEEGPHGAELRTGSARRG